MHTLHIEFPTDQLGIEPKGIVEILIQQACNYVRDTFKIAPPWKWVDNPDISIRKNNEAYEKSLSQWHNTTDSLQIILDLTTLPFPEFQKDIGISDLLLAMQHYRLALLSITGLPISFVLSRDIATISGLYVVVEEDQLALAETLPFLERPTAPTQPLLTWYGKKIFAPPAKSPLSRASDFSPLQASEVLLAISRATGSPPVSKTSLSPLFEAGVSGSEDDDSDAADLGFFVSSDTPRPSAAKPTNKRSRSPSVDLIVLTRQEHLDEHRRRAQADRIFSDDSTAASPFLHALQTAPCSDISSADLVS